MFKRSAAMLGAVAMLVTASPSYAATTLSVLAQPIAQSSLEELIPAYEKSHPDVKIHVDYAASNVTLAQIKNGAPIDLVFLPDALIAKESALFEQSALAFQTHTEIIVSKQAASKIHTPKDLGNKGVRLGGGTVGSVTEAFQTKMLMNLDKAFGPDLVARYKANVVTTNSISTVFHKQIDADLIDAAIVVAAGIPAGKYVVLSVPPDAPVINKYLVAVVKASANAQSARDFMAYLISASAQPVWKSHQFDKK
jgi:molybdate transport system substrate-binding protein